MTKFTIPVVWTMWGEIEIEADNISDACKEVMSPETSCPTNGHYLDDSFRIDREGISTTPEEDEQLLLLDEGFWG